jgi:hypothetical protein
MPKKQSRKKVDVAGILLKGFYDDAVKNGVVLLPDEAIAKLQEVIKNIVEAQKMDLAIFKRDNPRIDWKTETRRIHHYAVDLYYDTYIGKNVGAPPLTDEYLEYIVTLKEKDKLTFGQIGIRIGESPKAAEKIRKQYEKAKEKGIKPSAKKSQD